MIRDLFNINSFADSKDSAVCKTAKIEQIISVLYKKKILISHYLPFYEDKKMYYYGFIRFDNYDRWIFYRYNKNTDMYELYMIHSSKYLKNINDIFYLGVYIEIATKISINKNQLQPFNAVFIDIHPKFTRILDEKFEKINQSNIYKNYITNDVGFINHLSSESIEMTKILSMIINSNE